MNYAIDLPEMLDYLLQNGADYKNLQNSILCPILKLDYVESRDVLLKRGDVDVNEICNQGIQTTPLYEAIDANNFESHCLVFVGFFFPFDCKPDSLAHF